MPEITESEKAIFRVAVSLTDPSEREKFLRQACGSNDLLLRQLERLLAADDAADRFLKSPAELSNFTDDNSLLEKQSEQIGRYKLLHKIGEGGFGVVYMAEQQQPVVRRVALKIIKLGMDTRQVVARFEAERQALAMMDHPHIAKVFDGGATESGRPFFVMELVRGISIMEYCDQKQLANPQRLSLFLDICGAIQHAHQKGIIHRDLKPTNVLVTLHDGRPVPKVIDFGIAKATQGRLTDKTLFTRFEHFIGTPAYMSPEQAEMSGLDIDTRSDIYSLGVLLYELLTGQTPLDREELANAGYDEIRRRIREQEPPTPSTRLSSLQHDILSTVAQNRNSDPALMPALLRGELDWIVMKAVEKDRTRRYATADAFAEDIKRYFNGEPVSAVPPSTTYLVRKFIRRNRRLLTTFGIISATLLIVSVASSWLAVTATKARNQLADEVVARGQAVEKAQRIAYASDMYSASHALRSNNLYLVHDLLDRHRDFSDGTDLRNWEWRALWKQAQSDAVLKMGDGSHSIRAVSVGSDGKQLATASSSGIRLWDSRTGKLDRVFSSQDSRFVFFVPSGERLVAVSADGVVKSWSTPSFSEETVEFRHGSRVRDVCVSKNGEQLAVFGFDQEVSLWNVASRGKPTRLNAGTNHGMGEDEGRVAISPDDRFLAIGLFGQTRIFDLASQREVRVIPKGAKRALGFSPDGEYLAIGAENTDSTVYVYRVLDGRLTASFEGHTSFIRDVEFSPDSKLLASASADQTIRIWDIDTNKHVAVLRGHTDEVICVTFSGGDKQLISGGGDGYIYVWHPSEGISANWPVSVPNAVPGYWSHYSRASFSPDSKYLATRNRDNSVGLRSPDNLKVVRQLTHLGTRNRGVRFSPVESLLAVGNADGHLTLISPNRPDAMRSIELARGQDIFPIGFSRDGKQLLALAHTERRNTCIICSVPDGRELHRWAIPPDDRSVAFSPDGKLVVTGHLDNIVRIWSVADPREPTSQRRGIADAIAFSPTGELLAIGARKGEAEILDVESLATIGRLRVHMPAMHAIAFSPDGTRVVTGAGPDGNAVKIWDVASGRELMTLFIQGFMFRHVEFSPDGNAILAISGNGALNLWRVPSWEEIHATENGQSGSAIK